jgi:trigger factor
VPKLSQKELEKRRTELSWKLISTKLVSQLNLTATQEDLIDTARDATRAQLSQMGILNQSDDVIDVYAAEMLSKPESAKNLQSRALERKVASAIKSMVTLKKKKVSLEEFNKLFYI